jgi:hypothetical protein
MSRIDRGRMRLGRATSLAGEAGNGRYGALIPATRRRYHIRVSTVFSGSRYGIADGQVLTGPSICTGQRTSQNTVPVG